MIEVLLKRRLARLHRLKHAGDLSKFRIHPRGRDHRLPASIANHCPGINHIDTVADAKIAIHQSLDLLLNRKRFSC